jgi:hypothetical protein
VPQLRVAVEGDEQVVDRFVVGAGNDPKRPPPEGSKDRAPVGVDVAGQIGGELKQRAAGGDVPVPVPVPVPGTESMRRRTILALTGRVDDSDLWSAGTGEGDGMEARCRSGQAPKTRYSKQE